MNRRIRKSVFTLLLSLFLIGTVIDPAVFAENTEPVSTEEGTGRIETNENDEKDITEETSEIEKKGESRDSQQIVKEDKGNDSDLVQQNTGEGENAEGESDALPGMENINAVPVINEAASDNNTEINSAPAKTQGEQPKERLNQEENNNSEDNKVTEGEFGGELNLQTNTGQLTEGNGRPGAKRSVGLFANRNSTDQEISEVSLNVTAPMECSETTTQPAVTVSGDTVSITGKKWVKDSQGTDYEYSVYINAGWTYYIQLSLSAGESVFSENLTVSVNNNTGTVVYKGLSNDRKELIVRISVVAQALPTTPITSISLTITPPAAGTTVGNASYSNTGIVAVSSTVPEGAIWQWPQEASSGAFGWYVGSSKMADNETFQAGNTYKLYIPIYADKLKGYVFPDNSSNLNVNVTGADFLSKSLGTYMTYSTLSVDVNVTIPGGEPSYNVTGTNCTPSAASAHEGEKVTFTASIPDAYKDDDYSIAGWCIDGVWDTSTAESRTIEMPAHDLDAKVRYHVSRDTTTDDSQVTVSSDLVLTDASFGYGKYAGSVYSKTIDSTYATAGDPTAAQVQQMFSERDEAFTAKINEWAKGDRTQTTEQEAVTTEKRNWDDRTETTQYLDSAGNEATAENYVLKIKTRSGSYGKEYEYKLNKKVSYWSTSVIRLGSSEGGTITFKSQKGSATTEESGIETMNITVENASSVYLTANPAEGYKFVGWYKGIVGESGFVESYDSTEQLSTNNSYNFFLNEDKDVNVYGLFTPIVKDKKAEVVFSNEGDADYAEVYINGVKCTSADVAGDSEVTVQVKTEDHYTVWFSPVQLDGSSDVNYERVGLDQIKYTQPKNGTKVTVTVTLHKWILINYNSNGGIPGPQWDDAYDRFPYSEDQVLPFHVPEELSEGLVTAPEKYEYAGLEITDGNGTHVVLPGKQINLSLAKDITVKFLWKKSVKDYFVAEGSGSSWTKGSSNSLVFRFKSDLQDSNTYDLFLKLQIDGKDVSSGSYDKAPGSVVITLHPDYLETLPVGTHTIKAVFSDGDSPLGTFSIKEKTDSNSKKPTTPVDNVVTCQMAGYPSNYSWNEAAKACQPGYLDAGGNFHPYSATRNRGAIPNTGDMDLTIYAWIAMLTMTLAVFCGVKLLHEDWEV